ncbi:MAG TPA: Eco57I restriction-modification methylase domain-containing protein [Pseudolysinimonas sp.]|nr:Eco57I restriction-modification methylase domain-containing protein [Pseudolysinimonas sp.]
MTSPTLLLYPEAAPGTLTPSYGHEEKKRGAIFTKQSVVDFMLDLIGYDASHALHEKTLLEPSFGGGRFLLTAIDRLITSWRADPARPDYATLLNAIRAVELDTVTFAVFKRELRVHLQSEGFTDFEAARLADAWLINADYLWVKFDQHFDFVIGNPPYVRQELIEPDLLAAYRSTFRTMVGRADLYVPFIEKSLDALAPRGKLSFICADAWVKNEYGRALRQKVASGFHLRDYVDMYGVEAFEVGVGAYPSITVIQREVTGPSRVAKAESAEQAHLQELIDALVSPAGTGKLAAVHEVDRVANGSAPWLLSITHQLPIIRHMEAKFPTLGEAGCRIGIGVATGHDKAFIAPIDELDVEDDRKLPLATNKDVPNGQLQWTGKGIVNPYTDEGPLVDLAKYPRLAAHLERHRAALEKRHTAKDNVAVRWYKTIDRITPSLTWEEKLLIPDIKGDGDAIAYDPGTLYPHHNLYFITSSKWNLRALQAVLRSGIAHLFVEAYSVKIGRGYLRFQAQNLKRIRVPEWADVSVADQRLMSEAGESGAKLDTALLERIYQLEGGALAFLGETE